MYLDDENNVVDTTENVEETTEQNEGQEVTTEEEKTYTKAELDKLVGEQVDKLLPSKLERAKAKLERENQKKLDEYENIKNILSAGLGTDDLGEMEKQLRSFYTEQGVQIPARNLTERQIKVLAKDEADKIIEGGYEEIVSETDRLASIGAKNMTDSEKVIFQTLANERKRLERNKELEELGVADNKDYLDFANKLNPSLSEKEKVDLFEQFSPKAKKEKIGSMKNTASSEKGLKDYYTPEEAKKFTDKEIRETPGLYERISQSMLKWSRKK